MPNRSLLDLLLELQRLDRVPRSGYTLRGIAEPESVSEHSFHLVFLVWTLAFESPEIDRARAVEIALVHDLAEVRTGDLPATAARYLPAGAKDAAEMAAAEELLAPLGERALALFAEYQAGESSEARFVAACDKLQILIKAEVYEGWGAAGLGEFWRGFASDGEARRGDRLDDFPDGGFTAIRRLVGELRERRHPRPDWGDTE